MDAMIPTLYGFSLFIILGGLLISLYFYLHSINRIPARVLWLPSFVQIGECRCDEIMDTHFGKTFGVSNAFWAIWYYLLLFGLVLTELTLGWPGHFVLFVLTLLAMARSVYLIWALYILKVACNPCIAAHVINFILFMDYCIIIWPELIQ